jgi:hypothetical protein
MPQHEYWPFCDNSQDGLFPALATTDNEHTKQQ